MTISNFLFWNKHVRDQKNKELKNGVLLKKENVLQKMEYVIPQSKAPFPQLIKCQKNLPFLRH